MVFKVIVCIGQHSAHDVLCILTQPRPRLFLQPLVELVKFQSDRQLVDLSPNMLHVVQVYAQLWGKWVWHGGWYAQNNGIVVGWAVYEMGVACRWAVCGSGCEHGGCMV